METRWAWRWLVWRDWKREMLFQVGGQGSRPTFFEMAAAQQLPASLRAALTYSIGVLALRRPFLHKLLDFEDESFALLMLVLESHTLRTTGTPKTTLSITHNTNYFCSFLLFPHSRCFFFGISVRSSKKTGQYYRQNWRYCCCHRRWRQLAETPENSFRCFFGTVVDIFYFYFVV